MAKSPVISVFAPAIYPENWLGLCKSLSSNEVPYEIIFVGDKVPDFTLPDNLHFIYSKVKPAQCAELATRYAAGELLLNTGDDFAFSEHALDRMYEMHRSYSCDKIIVCARYVHSGKDWTDEAAYYWWGETKSPRISAGILMKKSMWRQLGGIDQRFVAQCWDIDMAMRMYEIGGAVSICNDVFMEEIVTKRRLYTEVGAPVDRPFLDWLWVRHTPPPESLLSPQFIHCVSKEKGVLSKSRLSPVIPFDDRHILTRSQGPRGRWR